MARSCKTIAQTKQGREIQMTLQINLKGRVALITGGSGELGRVMARSLASCGADVGIHFHHGKERAEALAEELRAIGVQAVTVTGDVGSFDDVAAMKPVMAASLGLPDIVVANAVSQILPWKTLLEEELGDYEDQFRSCVLQNVHLAKVFAPSMVEKRYGRFIGINTECAMAAGETQSAYASAKRGMDGIYRVLAKELGPSQITVNQIAPGWTVSEKDRENNTVEQESYSRNVPLRRRGTDQEIANVVAFVASDLASFITGAYIPVCGGIVMPAI